MTVVFRSGPEDTLAAEGSSIRSFRSVHPTAPVREEDRTSRFSAASAGDAPPKAARARGRSAERLSVRTMWSPLEALVLMSWRGRVSTDPRALRDAKTTEEGDAVRAGSEGTFTP